MSIIFTWAMVAVGLASKIAPQILKPDYDNHILCLAWFIRIGNGVKFEISQIAIHGLAWYWNTFLHNVFTIFIIFLQNIATPFCTYVADVAGLGWGWLVPLPAFLNGVFLTRYARQFVVQCRLAQVGGNPQSLTWSWILKVRMLIFPQNLRLKHRKSSFWEQKQQCSDFFFFWFPHLRIEDSGLRTENWGPRTEEWGVRTEDWGQPFHLLWLASFSPFETTKILKIPHKLEKSSHPGLQYCTTCATLTWPKLMQIGAYRGLNHLMSFCKLVLNHGQDSINYPNK